MVVHSIVVSPVLYHPQHFWCGSTLYCCLTSIIPPPALLVWQYTLLLSHQYYTTPSISGVAVHSIVVSPVLYHPQHFWCGSTLYCCLTSIIPPPALLVWQYTLLSAHQYYTTPSISGVAVHSIVGSPVLYHPQHFWCGSTLYCRLTSIIPPPALLVWQYILLSAHQYYTTPSISGVAVHSIVVSPVLYHPQHFWCGSTLYCRLTSIIPPPALLVWQYTLLSAHQYYTTPSTSGVAVHSIVGSPVLYHPQHFWCGSTLYCCLTSIIPPPAFLVW